MAMNFVARVIVYRLLSMANRPAKKERKKHAKALLVEET